MDKFKEMYLAEVVNGDGSMSSELIALFDEILANEFGGNHDRMDTLIADLNYHPSELELARQEVSETKQLVFDLMEYVSSLEVH